MTEIALLRNRAMIVTLRFWTAMLPCYKNLPTFHRVLFVYGTTLVVSIEYTSSLSLLII
jgi:hypothetical protein